MAQRKEDREGGGRGSPWRSAGRMNREGEAAMEGGKPQTLASNEDPWAWRRFNGGWRVSASGQGRRGAGGGFHKIHVAHAGGKCKTA